MAFAFKGFGGSTVTAVPDNDPLVLTTDTTGAVAGDFAVLLIAVDNDQFGDGDEGAVVGITDNAGNTWRKAVEFTNGQGLLEAGTTCGMWFSNLTANLPIGSTVTIDLSTVRDAFAVTLHYFTKTATLDGAVEGTPGTLADDNAAAGSLDVTTSNIACLRIRATASESNSTTVWTKTAAFDAVLTQLVTVIGGPNFNQGIRAEYDVSTGTGQASAPTGGAGAVDNASVYVAFTEVPKYAGFGMPQRDGQVIGRMIGY